MDVLLKSPPKPRFGRGGTLRETKSRHASRNHQMSIADCHYPRKKALDKSSEVFQRRIASFENTKPRTDSKALDDPFISSPNSKSSSSGDSAKTVYKLKSLDSEDIILLKTCAPSPTSARRSVFLNQQSLTFSKTLRQPAAKTQVESSTKRALAATLPRSFLSGTMSRPSISTKERVTQLPVPKKSPERPLAIISEPQKSPSKSPTLQTTKARAPVLLTQLRAQRHKSAAENSSPKPDTKLVLSPILLDEVKDFMCNDSSSDSPGGVSILRIHQVASNCPDSVENVGCSNSKNEQKHTTSQTKVALSTKLQKTMRNSDESAKLLINSDNQNAHPSLDRISRSSSSTLEDSDILIVTEKPQEPFKAGRNLSLISTATEQTVKPAQISSIYNRPNKEIVSTSGNAPSSKIITKSYAAALQGNPGKNGSERQNRSAAANTTSTPYTQCSNSNTESTSGGVDIPPVSPIAAPAHPTSTLLQGSCEKSKSSGLRATANSFIPGSSKPSPTRTWKQLAENGVQQNGHPPVEFLEPWSTHKDEAIGLRHGTVYYDVDQNMYQDAFGYNYAMTNLCSPLTANQDWNKRVPWCSLAPRLYVDNHVLGTADYKVQIPEITKEDNLISGPPGLIESANLSPQEIKRRQEHLHVNILEHEIREQQRTLTSLATEGPGKHPHTMPSLHAFTENMWMKPIGLGHPYTDFTILPHVRSKEWQDISIAIKLLNKEYAKHESKLFWEPDIPTGFSARASHNQPGRILPTKSNLIGLRGGSGGEDEWEWVNFTVRGCNYCGDPLHLRPVCSIWNADLEGDDDDSKTSDMGSNSDVTSPSASGKARCLNCGSRTHILRHCKNSPCFDDEFPRFKKLQFYAHTEHWRQTLYQQHMRFACRKSFSTGRDFPSELRDGIGDAALAFSWFPCAACAPETHWGDIQDTITYVRWLCKQQMLEGLENEDGSGLESIKRSKSKPPFYDVPNWMIEYGFCPVVWTIMHKETPDRAWAVLNPMNSVAVDAFWRTAMKAMGWDAPGLPDESILPKGCVV